MASDVLGNYMAISDQSLDQFRGGFVTSDGIEIGTGADFQYSFTEPGTYEVCMEIVFGGGSETVCKTILIEDNVNIESEFNKLIKVYPNPSHNTINIELEGYSDNESTITIRDVIGRVSLQQKLNSSLNSIDISELTKGIYYYEVVNNDERIKVEKLIIE